MAVNGPVVEIPVHEIRDRRIDELRESHIRRAKALLQDTRVAGDHGFTGEALRTWENMRASYGRGLRIVAAGGLISRDAWLFISSRACPKKVSMKTHRTGWGPVQGGTQDGEDIVAEALELMQDARELAWKY